MLVLSRGWDALSVKRGKNTIVIGEGENEVRVVLIETRKGRKARIGIEAGKHIPVHRLEVREAIERKKQRGEGTE